MSDLLGALERTAAIARSRAGARPALVGISGAQGSGKSTLAARFAEKTSRAVHISLDDFYLTKSERADLAAEVHPLFATRGVPGTHDVNLLGDTIGALMGAGASSRTRIPRFDKLADDRLPQSEWRTYSGRPDLIVLEGWCLGASAQHERALAAPINELEAREDRQGLWRRHANQHLAGPYHDLFVCLDAIFFLQAPSFDAVLGWRSEQEADLLGRALTEAERAAIAPFIAHYERLTRHMLAGGRRADVVAGLDERRVVKGVHEIG